MTLLNLLKLSKISSVSDSLIHTAERMEAAPDLFGINGMGRVLGNLTVQSVIEDLGQI